jgi:uncharacterized HAD superfamily protein
MSKLNLGIDIDGTITDPSTFIPYLNKAFNKELSFSDITQFHLPPLYQITDEEFFEWFIEHEGNIYSDAQLSEYATEVLNELAKEHTLIYISARDQKHHPLTLDWFNKNKVPYHQIELIGSHNKIKSAKEKRIELFFEDKLDNANELAEELKIPIILFDTPYNQGTQHQNVKRVFHWREAKGYVDSRINSKGTV